MIWHCSPFIPFVILHSHFDPNVRAPFDLHSDPYRCITVPSSFGTLLFIRRCYIRYRITWFYRCHSLRCSPLDYYVRCIYLPRCIVLPLFIFLTSYIPYILFDTGIHSTFVYSTMVMFCSTVVLFSDVTIHSGILICIPRLYTDVHTCSLCSLPFTGCSCSSIILCSFRSLHLPFYWWYIVLHYHVTDHSDWYIPDAWYYGDVIHRYTLLTYDTLFISDYRLLIWSLFPDSALLPFCSPITCSVNTVTLVMRCSFTLPVPTYPTSVLIHLVIYADFICYLPFLPSIHSGIHFRACLWFCSYTTILPPPTLFLLFVVHRVLPFFVTTVGYRFVDTVQLPITFCDSDLFTVRYDYHSGVIRRAEFYRYCSTICSLLIRLIPRPHHLFVGVLPCHLRRYRYDHLRYHILFYSISIPRSIPFIPFSRCIPFHSFHSFSIPFILFDWPMRYIRYTISFYRCIPVRYHYSVVIYDTIDDIRFIVLLIWWVFWFYSDTILMTFVFCDTLFWCDTVPFIRWVPLLPFPFCCWHIRCIHSHLRWYRYIVLFGDPTIPVFYDTGFFDDIGNFYWYFWRSVFVLLFLYGTFLSFPTFCLFIPFCSIRYDSMPIHSILFLMRLVVTLYNSLPPDTTCSFILLSLRSVMVHSVIHSVHHLIPFVVVLPFYIWYKFCYDWCLLRCILDLFIVRDTFVVHSSTMEPADAIHSDVYVTFYRDRGTYLHHYDHHSTFVTVWCCSMRWVILISIDAFDTFWLIPFIRSLMIHLILPTPFCLFDDSFCSMWFDSFDAFDFILFDSMHSFDSWWCDSVDDSVRCWSTDDSIPFHSYNFKLIILHSIPLLRWYIHSDDDAIRYSTTISLHSRDTFISFCSVHLLFGIHYHFLPFDTLLFWSVIRLRIRLCYRLLFDTFTIWWATTPLFIPWCSIPGILPFYDTISFVVRYIPDYDHSVVHSILPFPYISMHSIALLLPFDTILIPTAIYRPHRCHCWCILPFVPIRYILEFILPIRGGIVPTIHCSNCCLFIHDTHFVDDICSFYRLFVHFYHTFCWWPSTTDSTVHSLWHLMHSIRVFDSFAITIVFWFYGTLHSTLLLFIVLGLLFVGRNYELHSILFLIILRYSLMICSTFIWYIHIIHSIPVHWYILLMIVRCDVMEISLPLLFILGDVRWYISDHLIFSDYLLFILPFDLHSHLR